MRKLNNAMTFLVAWAVVLLGGVALSYCQNG